MFTRHPILFLSCSALALFAGLFSLAYLLLRGSDMPQGVYVPWRDEPVDPFLAPYMVDPESDVSAVEVGVEPDRVKYILDQTAFRGDSGGTIINLQRIPIASVNTRHDLRFILERAKRSEEPPGGLTGEQEAGLLSAFERALEQRFWPDPETYIASVEPHGVQPWIDDALYSLYPRGVPPAADWRHKVRLLDAALKRVYGPESPWTGLAPDPLEIRVRRFETEEAYRLAETLMARAMRWAGLSGNARLADTGPPVADRLNAGQRVLIADLLFLARHRTPPALTSPYMLRLSWDAERGVWQPEELSGFVHTSGVSQWGLF